MRVCWVRVCCRISARLNSEDLKKELQLFDVSVALPIVAALWNASIAGAEITNAGSCEVDGDAIRVLINKIED